MKKAKEVLNNIKAGELNIITRCALVVSVHSKSRPTIIPFFQNSLSCRSLKRVALKPDTGKGGTENLITGCVMKN